MVGAELDDRDRLARVLEAIVPSDWPPEHHDPDTLRFWHEQLSRPGAAGWWLHYVLLTVTAHPTLVGSAGYKGPPSDGVVEIGYSVVPTWQRRGLATEASRALIGSAWQRGATTVVAHTLPHLEPSIRVLHKLGFVPSESSEGGELVFTVRRPAPRR
jgi:RimJ/RimL family protein N-acetyltransferase